MTHWPGAEFLAPTEDGRFRRLVVQEDRLRSASLSFAPQDRVPEHAHPGSDEIFFVVSGTGRISVEKEIHDVGPGDLLFVGAGRRHAILAGGTVEDPFVIVAVVAPNLGDDAVFSDGPFPIPDGD